jgi:hypothetical protein
VLSRDLLTIRVAEEQSELARIRACLDTAPCVLAPMLRIGLEGKLEECSARLADALPNGYVMPADEAWTTYEAAARMAEQLRTEVFCYVAGALLRREGIDQGVGRTADLLLDELAEHARLENPLVTSLSFTNEPESLNPMINLVRLRFPGAGVWDLPLLAHEFGHHLMHGLSDDMDRDRRPIVGLVDKLGAMGAESARHMEELFADVCATYALGPAYPLSCLVLRVPRSDLKVETESHPSWRYRVSAMIEALCFMTRQIGLPDYQIAADRWVRPQWDALSGGLPLSGSQEPGVGAVGGEPLGYWVHRMILELRSHANGLLYEERGDQADRVAHLLADGAIGASLPANCRVVHVLNGAWRWRLGHIGLDDADELDRVGATAILYCERARRGRGG